MTARSHNKVELLAPAGGPDALRAAVNNGADAVYLGLGALNARRGADNFDLVSLEEGAHFAHLRGARVYLTANVVVLEREMGEALGMIDAAWCAGVDAVIVQDLGLLRLVASELPDVRIHASTQIDAQNPETVRALASLGARRVTLARELDAAAIGACASAGIEVETFVHGAICYSHSGQCLMSSMIGRRSANRGLCAQPCRLPYELLDQNGVRVEAPGRHLLSSKDMAGIAHLPALIRAGVSALKIEGRMKAPEYVAIVTGVYRGALDRALRNPESYSVHPSEWELLEEAFNRGFTDGYLTGQRGEALMSYARPNNRGVPLGRVTATAGRTASVALDRSLESADTIEVWTRSGRFAQPAGELRVDDRVVTTAPYGSTVEFVVAEPVATGDRVFRVTSASLVEAARRTFSGAGAVDHRAVPVSFTVRAHVGEPLSITARAAGAEASVTGPVVERARTKPITPGEVMEHVGRLGGSGFVAAQWDVDLDADAGMGYSTLHRVRREALDALAVRLLEPWSGRRPHRVRVPRPTRRARGPSAPRVVVTAWDAGTAAAAIGAGADDVYQRVFGVSEEQALPDGVRPLLPRTAMPEEVPRQLGLLDGGDAIVGNLGVLAAGSTRARVAADWGLNVINAHSAAAVRSLGAASVWASPESSGRQLADLVTESPLPVGCLVWGRVELMVAEQCVLQAAGPCDRRCSSCARRRGWWRLRDQKGYEFPVTTDASGRSHVLNAVTLDLTRALGEIVEAGVDAVRIDLSDEPAGRAAEVVGSIVRAVRVVASGGPAPASPLIEPATSGHFFRGLL